MSGPKTSENPQRATPVKSNARQDTVDNMSRPPTSRQSPHGPSTPRGAEESSYFIEGIDIVAEHDQQQGSSRGRRPHPSDGGAMTTPAVTHPYLLSPQQQQYLQHYYAQQYYAAASYYQQQYGGGQRPSPSSGLPQQYPPASPQQDPRSQQSTTYAYSSPQASAAAGSRSSPPRSSTGASSAHSHSQQQQQQQQPMYNNPYYMMGPAFAGHRRSHTDPTHPLMKSPPHEEQVPIVDHSSMPSYGAMKRSGSASSFESIQENEPLITFEAADDAIMHPFPGRTQSTPRPPRSRSLSADIPRPSHRRAYSDNVQVRKTLQYGSSPQLNRRLSRSPSVPGHRRTRSGASRARSETASIFSEASFVSHRTDLRKSSLVQQNPKTGELVLTLPFERVHLTMKQHQRIHSHIQGLERGHLYQYQVDPDVYEEYHFRAEELEHGVDPLDRVDDEDHCLCDCANCAGCTAKQELLPPLHYVLRVDDSLYRRMMDEVGASRRMPCGLFFCGHHHDVDRPSLMIAVLIIGSLFIGMGVLASVTQS